MKKITLLLPSTLLVSALLFGCQIQSPPPIEDNTELAIEDLQKNNEYYSVKGDPWSFMQSQLQIEIPDNKRITSERNSILNHPTYFENTLIKAEPYIYYIVDQLRQRNMPLELALIPLIESAYNPQATSFSKAAGLWQIVPITAREFGLQKSNWYDARRDLIESTNTALNLLQYLNKNFNGDWLLTLAAYNAGEGRVKRAINWNKSKGLPTNYWALNLSKETMRYVPKFIAVADIIKYNEQYNITLPSSSYNNALVQIELEKQIKLEKIAQYADMPLSDLLAFNAAYTKKEVKGPYHVFIPSAYVDTVHAKLAESNLVKPDIINLIAENSDVNPTVPLYDTAQTNSTYVDISDQDINYYEQQHRKHSQIVYRVRSGDNLYSIAKTHKVKVSELVQWNSIKNVNYLKPGDRLTINIRNGSSL